MSPPSKKKNQAFNNPFKGLSLKQAPEAPKAPPPPKKPVVKAAPAEDEALFLEAMDGVHLLRDRPAPPKPGAPLPPRVNEEAESLAQLAELVSGQGTFDLSDTDEFIEGAVPELDARVRRSLRRGEFALQGHVDLHGMTQVEAKAELERFLGESHRVGRRCVVVIHGRGLHSKDQIPVLKERVKVWLTQGHLSRRILAFCTARPHDGGAGALYVLLRR